MAAYVTQVSRNQIVRFRVLMVAMAAIVVVSVVAITTHTVVHKMASVFVVLVSMETRVKSVSKNNGYFLLRVSSILSLSLL